MLAQLQNTFYKKEKDIKEQWFLIDCKDKVLGKVASKAANILRGKNDFHYTPHMPNKNHLILINADQIVMTGNKISDNTRKCKYELRHTGYMGGLKSTPTREILNSKNLSRIVKWFKHKVIQNMLPGNKSRNNILKKCHIYIDDKHKHTNHKIQTVAV
ncbi:MAG: 50S ribosomal protein L13 [Pseudomonadota bacterium]